MFREKKREREFQIEMLDLELEHESKKSTYSAFLAVGTAFAALGLTTLLASYIASVDLVEVSSLLYVFVLAYTFLGGILIVVCVIQMDHLHRWRDREFQRIREKYLKEW